jgi:hypothetical protein
MAKETKAARVARERVEMETLFALRKVSYPQRLMEVLHRAQAMNFEVDVEANSMSFSVFDRDERDSGFEVAYAYSEADDEELDSLERSVKYKEFMQAEETRKYTARRAALAKLTAEELELLGL